MGAEMDKNEREEIVAVVKRAISETLAKGRRVASLNRTIRTLEEKKASLERDVEELTKSVSRIERTIKKALAPKEGELQSHITRLDRIFREVMELRSRVETELLVQSPDFKALMEAQAQWDKERMAAN
jgi:predicted  nucleic acid-binding Zn-ribbon protein